MGPCDVVTGACGNGGCKDGWKGKACNESCPLGSYSINCSKQCQCLVGPCDGVTGECGNGGCKDGWKGKACNESCSLGSYSLNCSKHCQCLMGPCDKVTGACGNGGCTDGWKGIACNETSEDTKQSSTIIWISTASGSGLLIVCVTTIVCVCSRTKKRKRALEAIQSRRSQFSRSFPTAGMHITVPSQKHYVRCNPEPRNEKEPDPTFPSVGDNEYLTLSDLDLEGSDYHHIADCDVYSSEYAGIANATGTSLQSYRALPPIPGATSSTDDDNLQPVTANLSKDISLETKDKPLRQTSGTWYITPVTRELSVEMHALLNTNDKPLRRASLPLNKTSGTIDLSIHKFSTL
ncbi:hypothetical protein DPMN_099652 [Dreissena polymorpha]|uniref:Uncharacterized protein n=1 Tax=Dreissena polymorpha TaxID=45954 RepID=A0A9D4R8D4_DREPO|nr:hypothetical protein DPMN_099652 [Dreissena polymorpha]